MELKIFGGHSMSYKTIYILKTCMFMPKFSSWKMVEIFPNKPLLAYLVRCANLLVLPLLLPMIPPQYDVLTFGSWHNQYIRWVENCDLPCHKWCCQMLGWYRPDLLTWQQQDGSCHQHLYSSHILEFAGQNNLPGDW